MTRAATLTISQPDRPAVRARSRRSLLCAHRRVLPSRSFIRRCGVRPGRELGQDLRWLAAVGLVRREPALGSCVVSDPAAIYRLSEPGHALAKSVVEHAKVCDNLRSCQERAAI